MRQLNYFSEQWREVASSVTLNLLNCPMLEYVPEMTKGLDLTGLTVRDIIETGNVVELCGKLSRLMTKPTK